MHEGGAAGLRGVGMAVEVYGIELISGGSLFDGGETGDAVERIRLHSKPGGGDHVAAMRTDSIRPCVEGCQRLLDPAKFFDGEQLHGQGDIEIVLGGGLVDRVGKELGFRGDQMRYRRFVCERRPKPIQFVLKVRVIGAFPHVDVRVF